MKQALIVSLFFCLVASLAHAGLEVPTNGSNQSGIGDITGWFCNDGTYTYTIDNGPAAPLVYGTNRNDTIGPCGDANNGFIQQFNWNLIPSGQHTIRIFFNGQQIDQATFTSTNIGTEFLTGASGSVSTTLAGRNVTLTWQQNQQNFVITSSTPVGVYPNVAGTWSVSVDFVTENCNFIQVPPDLPTHLSGTFTVQQTGNQLTIFQGSQIFTGDLETNGDFTVVSEPEIDTAGSCTFGLVAGYDGNFLNNEVVFLILADRISGTCTGITLPCFIGYEGPLLKVSALSELSQGEEVSPAEAFRAIIDATQLTPQVE